MYVCNYYVGAKYTILSAQVGTLTQIINSLILLTILYITPDTRPQIMFIIDIISQVTSHQYPLFHSSKRLILEGMDTDGGSYICMGSVPSK